MMKFIELYIIAAMLWSTFFIIGKLLFEETKKMKPFKLILCIMSFALALSYLNFINSEILVGVIKILCIYTLFCLYYKIVFKKDWAKVLVASLILYLFLCASEVIVVLIATGLLERLNLSMADMKNNLVMNALIAALEYFLIYINRAKLIAFIKNSNMKGKANIIIIFLILITLALLGFKMPVVKWTINGEFIVTMVILLSFCIIGVLIIKQNSDIQKTTSMYHKLVEYSDITNNLLEDYRLVSHEHKNQLSIIRGMLDNKNKELITYVEDLLEKRNIIKYQWIGELNHLPLSGLKGLINYKLMEMEQEKINIGISISRDLAKTKINKLNSKQKDHLYSIMGVYLDNAIQATKESRKKEISIEIYKDKNNIVIALANTYKGKIELEKLDEYGYTTKGKNHGIGLHIVKRIIEEDKIFLF